MGVEECPWHPDLSVGANESGVEKKDSLASMASGILILKKEEPPVTNQFPLYAFLVWRVRSSSVLKSNNLEKLEFLGS